MTRKTCHTCGETGSDFQQLHESINKQEAESHCIIFCQGDAEMKNWLIEHITNDSKKAIFDQIVMYGGFDGRIQACSFTELTRKIDNIY